MLSIEELAVFCKSKGIVYPSSEIYGGLSGFFDFGPYGVELFNNLKASWWKYFVQDREDIVGIDASVISHPRVWKASGHLDNFGDLLLTCSNDKCKEKVRADHYIEEKLDKNVEGLPASEVNKIVVDNDLKCPECEGEFKELKSFNLLFPTKIGADDEKANTAYLRGETAQGMFTNFKQIVDTTRQKVPFGIAQVGKCFRNEIAPRDFLFRCREFTIAEFEYFLHPEKDECPYLEDRHKELKVRLHSAEEQENGGRNLVETTIGDMLKDGRMGNWHGYLLAEQLNWLLSIGLSWDKMIMREHMKAELSHYSSATFDFDYEYPFGSSEMAGNANRGQYDLMQHAKESGQKLEIFDEESKQKILPRVIEPTFGMDRIFIALLCEAYEDDKDRGNKVLKLDSSLSPVKVAVFPLVNKLNEKGREVFDDLRKSFVCSYDKSGSVGRRYARADELGIPFCVTVDFDTLEDGAVTIRHRDTTEQERVPLVDLKARIFSLLG